MHRTILLVEDDQDLRDIITYILEGEGYSVHYLEKPSILWQLKNYKPDLLLIDAWQTGQQGHQLCQQINKHAALQQVPLLLMSTSARIEALAKECHARSFISKPFNLNEFLTTVQSLT